MDVQFVHYPSESHPNLQALGVAELHIPQNELDPREICIFSQELLTDCERIGVLVYSPRTANGQNQWLYLCNNCQEPAQLQGVHMFDFQYLKDWVVHKGLYIECPVCKATVAEEKQHIRESEIDSMEQLKEKREAAHAAGDEMMVYFNEQLILDKACDEYWDPIENPQRKRSNETALTEVLSNWCRNRKIDEFRTEIVAATKRAIALDSISILKLIIKHCKYIRDVSDDRKSELNEFLDCAAENGAMDCAIYLAALSNMEWGQRPNALFLAVRSMNEHLANVLLVEMQKSSRGFVCDDVMAEVIKTDMVDVARQIIENRWHKPTEKDFHLADQVRGSVYEYFQSRRAATDTVLAMAESDGLDLDDWGGDSDGDEEWADDDAWS